MNHISSLVSILHFQISLAISIIHFQTILAPVLFLNFLCKFQLPGQCPGWARCEDGAVPPSRTLVSPGPLPAHGGSCHPGSACPGDLAWR